MLPHWGRQDHKDDMLQVEASSLIVLHGNMKETHSKVCMSINVIKHLSKYLPFVIRLDNSGAVHVCMTGPNYALCQFVGGQSSLVH